jgi:hypothetical protein
MYEIEWDSIEGRRGPNWWADWILLESGEIAWVKGTRACFIEARDNSLILLSSILLERTLWCLGSILELQL